LVVDDDPCCRYSLEAVLRSLGFSVISASNGVQAVDLAFVHQPKLIFMDLMMPDMDGYTATVAIHAGHTTTATPIVALSASSDLRHRFRALEAGMVAFVPKPWKVPDIQRILAKHWTMPAAELVGDDAAASNTR
jgi:CheY-like chemotaxis protein